MLLQARGLEGRRAGDRALLLLVLDSEGAPGVLGLPWDARGGTLLQALPPRPLFAQWRKLRPRGGLG